VPALPRPHPDGCIQGEPVRAAWRVGWRVVATLCVSYTMSQIMIAGIEEWMLVEPTLIYHSEAGHDDQEDPYLTACKAKCKGEGGYSWQAHTATAIGYCECGSTVSFEVSGEVPCYCECPCPKASP